MARIAKSLETLRNQINKLSPNRSKVSDGWIGDTAHSARTSDHNPNSAGVVCALDITHDPAHGVDNDTIANHIRESGDPRVNYIISNGRIANSNKEWRKYTGSNRHDKHFHVSVHQRAKFYDDASEWSLPGIKTGIVQKIKDVVLPPPVKPTLYKGVKNQVNNVSYVQRKLGITVDGIFGDDTKAAVVKFQKSKGLAADGIVGPYTWEKL